MEPEAFLRQTFRRPRARRPRHLEECVDHRTRHTRGRLHLIFKPWLRCNRRSGLHLCLNFWQQVIEKSQSPSHRGSLSHSSLTDSVSMRICQVSIPFASGKSFAPTTSSVVIAHVPQVSIPFASGKSFARVVVIALVVLVLGSQSPSHRGSLSHYY